MTRAVKLLDLTFLHVPAPACALLEGPEAQPLDLTLLFAPLVCNSNSDFDCIGLELRSAVSVARLFLVVTGLRSLH